MLLFLLSVGLTLIFGMLGVINLAHGSFYTLGAYAGLATAAATGSFWLALLIAPLVVAAAGALVEGAWLRPLYARGPYAQVLLTFGVIYLVDDVVRWIWGAHVRSMPPPAAFADPVMLGTVRFPSYRLFVIGFGFATALALWLLIERTRLGAVIRAGVYDAEMAAGLGVDIRRVFTGVFAGGAALAAVAGVVAVPIQAAYPGMGVEILVRALIVVVLGGLGSLKGSLAGSLILGQAETFGKAWLPDTAMFIIYGVMAVVLLVRPQGLFARASKGASTAASEPPPAGAGAAGARSRFRRCAPALAASAALVVVAGMPWFVGGYPVRLAEEILIWGMFAMSLDLLVGRAGMVSFGHSAFFGLGGYVAALALMHWSPSLAAALVAPVLAAAVAALAIGYLSIRVSGVYFIMLTLAFSQMLYAAAFTTPWLGASDGLPGVPRPRLAGVGLDATPAFHLYVVVLFTGALLALARIVRSPFGHVLRGIDENEARMAAVGYAVDRFKLMAFVVAGAIAGVAGAVYAQLNGYISPEALFWTTSGEALLMVIIGGAGTLAGPVLGAAAFILLQSLVSSYTERWMLILGLVFVIFVRWAPSGLLGLLRAPAVPAASKGA